MSVRTDDPEARWLAETYRPGIPQLTIRAVIAGMLLGAVMCVSNLYVFFKTGWSMGVTITAAILAYAVFRGLSATGIVKRPLGMLENNALITVSSGAGYMTGGGNMAAFGALLMITSVRPDIVPMILWFAVIAALGVFCAIPIKRQLINREGLVFPTGTATAETLRVLHGDQRAAGDAASSPARSSAGSRQAMALGVAAGFAALLTCARELKAMPIRVPGTIELPLEIAGRKAAQWSLSIKTEVVLVGAGALMSFRTAWSLLLGGLLTFGVLAPELYSQGLISEVNSKSIIRWTVIPGAAMLVAAGLTAFALDWRSVVRTFSGLGRIFGREAAIRTDPMDAVECPTWWFPAGFIVLGPIVVGLMAYMFQIPLWAGLIAVPLAIVMGFVAARVTGDTDVTPTKAFGPVTQLVYGVITPGNLTGNIMAANVTGGIGLHAADLLTTLKTGWLLGANPRAQFYAQLFGVAVGAAFIVPAFDVLIEDPSVLGGDVWPAPSCLVWAEVSKIFTDGIGALDSLARRAVVVGLALGVGLTLLEKFAPPRVKPFVPSPSGLGIAMIVPGSNSIAMFLGGAVAEFLRRNWRAFADRFVTPVASGFIAGESLTGITVAVLKAGKVLE
jgi:OPT family oligopeptide transporter